jgi:hypothetical protein
MTPHEFEIAFPKVMGWIQRTVALLLWRDGDNHQQRRRTLRLVLAPVTFSMMTG